MLKVDDRVKSLMRPSSSVKNSKKVTRTIDRKELNVINSSLEKILETNRQERINDNVAMLEKIMEHPEELDLYK